MELHENLKQVNESPLDPLLDDRFHAERRARTRLVIVIIVLVAIFITVAAFTLINSFEGRL